MTLRDSLLHFLNNSQRIGPRSRQIEAPIPFCLSGEKALGDSLPVLLGSKQIET